MTEMNFTGSDGINHVCQHTDENENACRPCHAPFHRQETRHTPRRVASRRTSNLTPRTPALLKRMMIANGMTGPRQEYIGVGPGYLSSGTHYQVRG